MAMLGIFFLHHFYKILIDDLVSATPVLGLGAHACPWPALYVGAKTTNSGPWAYGAESLLTEPST